MSVGTVALGYDSRLEMISLEQVYGREHEMVLSTLLTTANINLCFVFAQSSHDVTFQ